MFRLPEELQEAFDWNRFARVGMCTLDTSPSQTEFPAICFEKTRPLVALWGDSHAAALYPGLKLLQNKISFGVIQVDQAGGPPIFDVTVPRPNCNLINKNILNKLIQLRPDTIILSSAWVLPAYGDLNNEDLFKLKVSNTVAIIKKNLP